MKEAKTTNTKWWLSQRQKHSTKNSKVSPALHGDAGRGRGCVQAAPRDTSAHPQVCDLTGWWKNDLGSKMLVDKVDNHGNFSGEYHTAVSSTQKPIEPSPLIGSQHLDEDGLCTFGFTVNWKFSGQ